VIEVNRGNLTSNSYFACLPNKLNLLESWYIFLSVGNEGAAKAAGSNAEFVYNSYLRPLIQWSPSLSLFTNISSTPPSLPVM